MKLVGEYAKNFGLKMNIKCFLDSVGFFAKDDSMVDGGTHDVHNEK